MFPTEKLNRFLVKPTLTWRRMLAALLVAVAADSLQFLLGPLGWAGVDQAIDILAMLAAVWLVGFHLLLLPTVIVEFFPVVDALPTWTACVLAVIALRRREEKYSSPLEKPPVKSD